MKKILPATIMMFFVFAGLDIFAQTEEINIDGLPFLEEAPGYFRLGDFEIHGAIMGDVFSVDADFIQRFEQSPETPHFRVTVPRADNRSATGGGGQIMSIGYMVDDRAAEIIRFTNLTVPGKSREARLRTLANLLINDAPSFSFAGWDDGKFERIYWTDVNGYDAVVIQGWVTSAAEGEYWIRLYGILKPNSSTGILAFILIEPQLTGIDPVELQTQGVNLRIIHSLEFID